MKKQSAAETCLKSLHKMCFSHYHETCPPTTEILAKAQEYCQISGMPDQGDLEKLKWHLQRSRGDRAAVFVIRAWAQRDGIEL